jgi:hypothetical protein
MAKADPIQLIFQIERETKSKVRFQEMHPVEGNKVPTPVPKEKAVVEKLYVSKKDLKKMGNPDTLHVTIEAP